MAGLLNWYYFSHNIYFQILCLIIDQVTVNFNVLAINRRLISVNMAQVHALVISCEPVSARFHQTGLGSYCVWATFDSLKFPWKKAQSRKLIWIRIEWKCWSIAFVHGFYKYEFYKLSGNYSSRLVWVINQSHFNKNKVRLSTILIDQLTAAFIILIRNCRISLSFSSV